MKTPKPEGSTSPSIPLQSGHSRPGGEPSERPALLTRSIPVFDVAEELGDFEFDPDDVLASLRPYDEPESSVAPEPVPPDLDNERPASEFAQEHDFDDSFRTIAARLTAQLGSLADPSRGAETALCVSELHALLGDNTPALEFASRAVELAPTSRVARAQARHLTFNAEDYQSIPSMVESELACLADGVSKAQLQLWLSEFERVARGDSTTALERLERAHTEFQTDPQVNLLRFLAAIAEGAPNSLDRAHWSSLPFTDFAAVRELLVIRSGPLENSFGALHPAATLLDVASAFATGELAQAAQQLAALQSIPGCDLPLRWLRCSLLAQAPESRSIAINELQQLRSLESNDNVVEALLERAVEANNTALLAQLVDSWPRETGPNGAAEQLLLNYLAGQPSPRLRELFEDVTNDNSLVALAIAIMDLSDPSSSDFTGTDRRARALLTTARRLALASPSNPVSLPAWHALPDDSDEFVALDLALNLEQAHANGDWCALGHLLLDANENSELWLPGDRETVSAMFFEAGRAQDSARTAWEQVKTTNSSREAALRALLPALTDVEKRTQLEAYAEQFTLDDERVPWLLLEAALCASAAEPETAQRLLEHAHAISPNLVLTMTMGEDLARLAGNSEAAINWLGKRADLADDASEIALLAAQEALLHKGSDAAAAEMCASRALAADGPDPALLVLRDFVAPGLNSGDFERPDSGDPPQFELLCETAARAAWAGNWRATNESVIQIWESKTSEIATLWAELAATFGQRHQKLFEKLFSEARTETDPNVQRELYERLAKLDPNFGQEGATDLWLNAIVERAPDNLAALRGLERSAARRSRWPELITIAEKLVQQLDRNEANGYSWLASTLNVYTGNWPNGESVTEWAAQQQPAPLWALRRRYAYAAGKADWETVSSIQSRLAERANYAGDVTALRMRSAETAYRMGNADQALSELRAALDITPDHLVALSMLATWQLQNGDVTAAAETLEQVGQACSVPAHREAALSQAAEHWLSLGDEARAEFALEQLLVTNPGHPAAIAKLSQIYRAAHAHDKLAALLERQLEVTREPLERMQLQLERARCLLTLDLTIAADKALEPALQAFPENVDVLQVKADISLAVDDRHEAEFTYTRLLQLVTEPEKQAQLYRKLGALYERSADQADVAESTYRRLLDLVPNDNDALQALVRLRLASNDVTEAIRLQNQLVEYPSDADKLRTHHLGLSKIYETRANDRRKAEELLEKARRKWPNDSLVLRAFAEFYQRAADTSALQVLLERSVTEARRALNTGRFELAFFEILGTVAELRGQADTAGVAQALALALKGSPAPLMGVGHTAASPRHDEALAPELLNLPLRAMLQRTGWALDAAQPFDLRPLQVYSLGERNASLFDRMVELSRKFDLADLTLWVSPKLGATCVAAQCHPPVLVMGQRLVDATNEAAREFLIIRALKALQTQTACLTRVAAVDLWPLLAAYLGAFLLDWQPAGIDLKRFEEAKQSIQSALGSSVIQDMSTLAHDVVLALGNRSSQVGEAANEWGSRTAMLALGNPADALDALALTASVPPLPKDNPNERVKWVNRHAEARNLMIYAVSDAFLQLRSQLLRG